jgi:preprotein translocase SecE subunit
MGREMRRQQQRAERRQQQRQQNAQPTRSSAPQVSASTSGPGEAPRKSSLLKPRWAMDIISELRKVTWPNRREIMSLTVVVLVVSLLLGALLGSADLFFGWFVEQTILR